MAKIRLTVKAGDQKPFTRFNARKCSGATASKRVFGGTARWGGSTAKINGRRYVLGSDARQVPAIHDSGGRVGTRTVTLYGPAIKTLAEQAEEARKAAAGRRQARAARKAKATERAAAAEKARMPAERPDPRRQARTEVREQPRAAERPRSAGDERAARVRARAQEAEGRERLRASTTQDARPAPPRQDRVPQARQPAAREQERPAPQPRAAEHATRQPRAIEAPRPALHWLLRNPFARPEPENQPARAAAPAGRR